MRRFNLVSRLRRLAEGEGFEPPGLSTNGFQDRRFRPLSHPSSVREFCANSPIVPLARGPRQVRPVDTDLPAIGAAVSG